MPNYESNIAIQDYSGLSGSTARDPGKSTALADAAAIGQVLGQVGQIWGRSKAKATGTELGGATDTYEAAGKVVDSAQADLMKKAQEQATAQGKDVTADQAKDLRNQVFNKILINQKRIQSAVDRGLISSTEATSRLSVLRNEALSNPLIAPFANELDNALYRTTGGSGTTFAATATELMHDAKMKGAVAAEQETSKQVSELINIGAASSETQAKSILAQMKVAQITTDGLAQKRALLGLNSQEVAAQYQTLHTMQATSAYQALLNFHDSGGKAEAKQMLIAKIKQDAELTKQAMRSNMRGKDGTLLIDSSTFSSSIGEVDKRAEDFIKMIDDMKGAKQLIEVMAERQAAMDKNAQDINIDLALRLPVLNAIQGNQELTKWYLDAVSGTNKMATEWGANADPVRRLLYSLPNTELHNQTAFTHEGFLQGGALATPTSSTILSNTLLQKGGKAAVDEAYKNNAEKTLTTLRDVPFTAKDIMSSPEWGGAVQAGKLTPQRVEQYNAIMEGASTRALMSSMYQNQLEIDKNPQTDLQKALGVPRNVKQFVVPEKIVVEPVVHKSTDYGRGASTHTASKGEWKIDTGGVPVSLQYQQEVVNAHKLATKFPEIWQGHFESEQDWLNHLFTRPIQTKEAPNATNQ